MPPRRHEEYFSELQVGWPVLLRKQTVPKYRCYLSSTEEKTVQLINHQQITHITIYKLLGSKALRRHKPNTDVAKKKTSFPAPSKHFNYASCAKKISLSKLSGCAPRKN